MTKRLLSKSSSLRIATVLLCKDLTLFPYGVYRSLRSALMIKIGPMVCFDMVGKSAFFPLFGKAL